MTQFKNGTTDYADGHGYSHNAKGSAWASQAGAAFSNPFSSALARNCENSASTRSASTTAFALEPRLWSLDSRRHMVAVDLSSGGIFGKASESSLASDFSKQLRHSCNESTLGFSGQQTGFSSSVIFREIRG